MSNMSYCRFQNTRMDLQDCVEVLRGEDSYYPNISKLSHEEKRALEGLIELAKELVEYDENRENEPFFDPNYKEVCLECEGKKKIYDGKEWVTCPSCDGTGLYKED
jgi:hypothetical protein